MILQWRQADDSSAYESYYPNLKQMAVIRRIYKEQGLYPFDVDSNGVYFNLAVDKMIRTATSLRLTKELVDWENSRPHRAVPKQPLGETDPARGIFGCTFKQHEDEIWNSELDDRVQTP